MKVEFEVGDVPEEGCEEEGKKGSTRERCLGRNIFSRSGSDEEDEKNQHVNWYWFARSSHLHLKVRRELNVVNDM